MPNLIVCNWTSPWRLSLKLRRVERSSILIFNHQVIWAVGRQLPQRGPSSSRRPGSMDIPTGTSAFTASWLISILWTTAWDEWGLHFYIFKEVRVGTRRFVASLLKSFEALITSFPTPWGYRRTPQFWSNNVKSNNSMKSLGFILSIHVIFA